MGQYIDIALFAALAAFLVVVLRGVLGRRTGAERPPVIPRIGPGGTLGEMTRAAAPSADGGKVIDLTARRQDEPLSGMAAIRAADPSFREETFLDGARQAFEMIVKAFAAGDTATLRLLVSDEVYDTFAEAIRKRLAAKEALETKITRMQDPEILDATLNGRTALITVKFVTGQVSVTRAADGAVIDGDAEKVVEHTDHWTFSRNTRSSDPNWFLVATGSHE